MARRMLSAEQKKLFESLRDLLQSCLALTEGCKDADGTRLVNERIATMESASLFVIVGEVKAGKSSFINALLGEKACAVAPDPCTAVIQELVYGAERSTTRLGDQWERVTLPLPVLQELSIVDTPGTNSIIRDHQTITMNFIPRCDLVVFVFPAKNPYTATAWDLLSHVREGWHRKVVFVLQQADIATKDELAASTESVRKYAREKGLQEATIFQVSAIREEQGAADSGFTEFRDYLRKAVEGGEVWRTKVDATREVVRRIASDLAARLDGEMQSIEEDKTFYGSLLEKVKIRHRMVEDLRELLVQNLCDVYDRLSKKLELDFSEGLSAGTVLYRSIPGWRDKDFSTWLQDLQSSFDQAARQEIADASEVASEKLVAEIKTVLEDLMVQIVRKLNAVSSSSITLNYPDRFAIISDLKKQLQDLRISDILDEGLQGAGIAGVSLACGGIAVLGGVVTLATNVLVFDITGGILAFAGASVVAFTLWWKRAGILDEVTKRLRKSRVEFKERLDKKISGIFDTLFFEIERRIREPFALLESRSARVISYREEANSLKCRAEAAGSEH